MMFESEFDIATRRLPTAVTPSATPTLPSRLMVESRDRAPFTPTDGTILCTPLDGDLGLSLIYGPTRFEISP